MPESDRNGFAQQSRRCFRTLRANERLSPLAATNATTSAMLLEQTGNVVRYYQIGYTCPSASLPLAHDHAHAHAGQPVHSACTVALEGQSTRALETEGPSAVPLTVSMCSDFPWLGQVCGRDRAWLPRGRVAGGWSTEAVSSPRFLYRRKCSARSMNACYRFEQPRHARASCSPSSVYSLSLHAHACACR